jgi:YVTN family beta-propeller protein
MRIVRRYEVAAAFVLAALFVLPLGAGFVSSTSAQPRPSGPSSDRALAAVPASAGSARLAPHPTVGYGAVGETYVIDNSTILPGQYENPYNIEGAGLVAVNPTAGLAFVGGPSLVVIAEVNLTTDRVAQVFPLIEGASALLLPPGSADLVVAENGTRNVTVVDTTTGKFAATFEFGTDPVALAFDPENSRVYVACESANEVGEFNFSTLQSGGVVTGSFQAPDALAVNPSADQLFVADYSSATVTVVNTSSDTATGTAPVGSGPDALAYFATTNTVFVGNVGSQNITVRSAATGALVGTAPLPFGPQQIVGDPAVGFLYVDNTTDVTIEVLDSATDAVEGSVAGYNGASTIALDPTTDWLYVAESVTNNLTVVAAATNSILASIRLGWTPEVVAYDSATGAFAYASPDTDLLTFVNATTGAFIQSFTTGRDPNSAMYDPVTECVYVTNDVSDSVTVVNGSTLQYTTTISAGVHPDAIALVEAYDYLFVANGGGTLTIINAGTNQVVGTVTVPVAEALTGIAYSPSSEQLYVGAGSTVQILGALNHTDWRAIVTPKVVGTIVADGYAPTVYAVSGVGSAPRQGNVTVINATSNLAAHTLNVSDALGGADYDARNGVVYVAESAGEGNLLAFNGTTSAELGVVATGVFDGAMADSGGRGSVFGVQSSGGTVSIVTLPGLGDYLVNVTETGLPVGQAWSVSFAGHAVHSATPWVTTTAPDETLPYIVGTLAAFAASPAAGNITVSGSVAFASIVFTRLPPRFDINFDESGLQSGTNWVVTCNGTRENTTNSDLTFLVGNGSVAYTVSSVAGYTITSNASGSIPISGRPVTINVTFVSAPASGSGTTNSAGFSLGAAEGYVVAVLAALVGGVAGGLAGRRGRSHGPPSDEAPAEAEGAPPAA